MSAPQAPADLRAALRLYCIADTGIRGTSGLVDAVSAALRGGVTCVQLRAKDLGTAEQVRLARALREICRTAGVPFVVNDRVDVALAAGADGVHVGHIGQEDMHPADARALLGDAALIGVSVASADEARAAEAAGASYVSAGPMYETSTKLDGGPAAGVTLVRSVRAATTLPVLGIGGITAARASEVRAAGADGVCVGAAIIAASDPAAAARAFADRNTAGGKTMSVSERSDVRTFRRLERLPRSQALALAAVFVALGVALSTFAIPVGPARVFPFQATINVIAGVLLGPWYALLTAFAISVLRNAAGTGTFLAFPGSIFGALLVGFAYRWWRSDRAAFLEPIGTAIVGALVGYALIAPLGAPTQLFGFLQANPPSQQPYLGLFTGALALVASFAVSSVPGAVLGFLALRALRRAGLR